MQAVYKTVWPYQKDAMNLPGLLRIQQARPVTGRSKK